VTFYNGTKVLSKVRVSKGVASLTTKSLPVGKLKIKAVFVPKSTTSYKGSTSAVISVTVIKPKTAQSGA
jgi:hypothetical protein